MGTDRKVKFSMWKRSSIHLDITNNYMSFFITYQAVLSIEFIEPISVSSLCDSKIFDMIDILTTCGLSYLIV